VLSLLSLVLLLLLSLVLLFFNDRDQVLTLFRFWDCKSYNDNNDNNDDGEDDIVYLLSNNSQIYWC